MEKYPTYKDSGIKWIGEIPDHWIVLKINKLFNVKAGGDAKPDFYSYDKDEAHPFPVYTNTIDEKVYAYTSQAIFKSNSITVTGRGAIGHAIYRDTPFDAIIRLLVLTPKKQTYNCKFFTFFIDVVIPFFSDSAAIGQLSAVQLSNFHTVAPPLHEQQSIVTFLEKETANIDAYIKQREQEINTLNELKQAEIAEAVTKGLNPNAPMKDSGIAWIGEIPEHWECKRIGSTYIENKHINSDLGCNEAYKFNYGSLVRKDEDVKLEEVADVYSKYTVISKNDIIINGLNLNYDFVTQRVAIVEQKGIITSAYVTITPRDEVNSEYFSYLFKSMDAKKLFNGMGTGIRLTLGFGELKKQQIPIPPKDEQDLIVKNIKAKTSKIEEYITTLKSEIAQMQEYKQRLISDVVTGKMKV